MKRFITVLLSLCICFSVNAKGFFDFSNNVSFDVTLGCSVVNPFGNLSGYIVCDPYLYGPEIMEPVLKKAPACYPTVNFAVKLFGILLDFSMFNNTYYTGIKYNSLMQPCKYYEFHRYFVFHVGYTIPIFSWFRITPMLGYGVFDDVHRLSNVQYNYYDYYTRNSAVVVDYISGDHFEYGLRLEFYLGQYFIIYATGTNHAISAGIGVSFSAMLK